jgi:cytochrome P450
MAKVEVFKDREPGPVRAETGADGSTWWLVTRYEDVVAAFADKRLSNKGLYPMDCAAARLVREQAAVSMEQAVDRVLSRSMIALDPPDHTRLRRLVAREFSAKHLESFRPRVQEIADELLDGIAGEEQVDLVRTFSFPLVVRVLCALLNFPETLTKRLVPEGGEPRFPGEAAYAAVVELIELRRKEPADDIVTGLIAAHEDGKLSDDELIGMPVMVLFAGLSTVQLIGSGILTLLRHPSQLAEVRRDPGLVSSVVDETLRYISPAASVTRYALEDIEIGGVTIPAGSQVRLLAGSAGHDPARYPDPERFDIHRGEAHELAFGYGIHFCLGGHLARVEGEVAIGSLVRRFPELALAEAVTVTEVDDGIVGLERLPLRLHA